MASGSGPLGAADDELEELDCASASDGGPKISAPTVKRAKLVKRVKLKVVLDGYLAIIC